MTKPLDTSNREAMLDGRFRLSFADGQYLFVSASSSPGYWRCVRKVVRRKLEAAQ
jgi:hypothetical protein